MTNPFPCNQPMILYSYSHNVGNTNIYYITGITASTTSNATGKVLCLYHRPNTNYECAKICISKTRVKVYNLPNRLYTTEKRKRNAKITHKSPHETGTRQFFAKPSRKNKAAYIWTLSKTP